MEGRNPRSIDDSEGSSHPYQEEITLVHNEQTESTSSYGSMLKRFGQGVVRTVQIAAPVVKDGLIGSLAMIGTGEVIRDTMPTPQTFDGQCPDETSAHVALGIVGATVGLTYGLFWAAKRCLQSTPPTPINLNGVSDDEEASLNDRQTHRYG